MFRINVNTLPISVFLTKKHFSYKYFLIFLLTLLLTGCQTTQSDELSKLATEAELNNPLFKSHISEVTKISNRQYSAKGNFAYLSTDFKQSASFYWEQLSQDNYKLRLLNPLGQTVVSIIVDNSVTSLTDDKGQVYTYSNPEEAILDLANMDIPITQLRLWMLGLPGEASQISLNSNYQLKSSIYQTINSETTWRVNYLNYDYTLKPALPSLLEIIQQNGNETLEIKLKINRWGL